MKLKRTHHCGLLRAEHKEEEVVLNGWIHTMRDHGGVFFANLRDRSGVAQLVFQDPTVLQQEVVHPEYVVAVKGVVMERPNEAKNPEMATGEIEVSVKQMVVLSPSEAPPLDVSAPREEEAGENTRLRYRYLDLRRERLKRNLTIRHRACQLTRRYLDSKGFLELETPFLTKSTPEGARDFLVPSRVNRGRFYALPQSPQLFKQLFMVAGLERYFQLVRCFRDEDLRADRQPEFTQIDVEMSFVDEGDIRQLTDGLIALLLKEILQVEIRLPVQEMTYQVALKTYGTDRPDLRFGLKLVELNELAADSQIPFLREGAEKGQVTGLAAPEKNKLSRKQIERFAEEAKAGEAGGFLWFRRKGNNISGPGAKAFKGEKEAPLLEKLSVKDGDLVFVVAGNERQKVLESAGALRTKLAKELSLIPERTYIPVWITGFPMFEKEEETGRWAAVHHPFTAPREEDIALLKTDPGSVRARAYDIVINGAELGGGSIRIHNRQLQEKIFGLLRIDPEQAKEKFGFLLESLRYGAPPHGGIAFGLDRIAALLAGEESIRDVIAFPKTHRGVCPLTGAPGSVGACQLRELGLKQVEPPQPDQEQGGKTE